MKKLTATPLASLDGTWKYLPQTMVPITATKPAHSAPAGMVHVPKANFSFKVSGVEIEGDDGHGVDVQYPWEPHPNREHSHDMEVGPFFMDKYPVTCANYSAYLAASKYHPKETYNWLKNWNGSATAPAALADVPVTYVSLREARAYCAWAHGGSRLPHSYEWQYAAQGTDGRAYPWGPDDDKTKYPTLSAAKTIPGAESVTAHAPAGDSPFGVSDMVGNVWQYTDEFRDAHTAGVIVRGGSNYRPAGSGWYFPHGGSSRSEVMPNDKHNKYFLMDDTYERCGTIGFRCVVDAAA